VILADSERAGQPFNLLLFGAALTQWERPQHSGSRYEPVK
jgi:hypothetical protein